MEEINDKLRNELGFEGEVTEESEEVENSLFDE